MYDYCKTWFEGEWSNWMIYCSKPGLANTNSNIESFNNVLKRDYFRSRKVPMRAALDIIIECIVCYSTTMAEFKTMPVPRSSSTKFARQMTASNFSRYISRISRY